MEAIFPGCKLGWSLRKSHLWLLVKKFRGEQRAPCLSVQPPAMHRRGRSSFLMPPTSMVIPCIETAASQLSWASTCFSSLLPHRGGELLFTPSKNVGTCSLRCLMVTLPLHYSSLKTQLTDCASSAVQRQPGLIKPLSAGGKWLLKMQCSDWSKTPLIFQCCCVLPYAARCEHR